MVGIAAMAANDVFITQPNIRAEEAAAEAADLKLFHGGEASFTGVVTGYEANEGEYGIDCDGADCVRVDKATVNLDLITTFGASCLESVDEAEAVRVKEDLLPIGTEVGVIRGDTGDEFSGFIHIRDEVNINEPVRGSANEQLVTSGYWVPDASAFNVREVQEGKAATYGLDYPLSPIQTQYAPYILEAANGARANAIGGQEQCIAQLIADQEEKRRLEEEKQKYIKEGGEIRQQWLRDNPGSLYCRDGDGDGVCNEG